MYEPCKIPALLKIYSTLNKTIQSLKTCTWMCLFLGCIVRQIIFITIKSCYNMSLASCTIQPTSSLGRSCYIGHGKTLRYATSYDRISSQPVSAVLFKIVPPDIIDTPNLPTLPTGPIYVLVPYVHSCLLYIHHVTSIRNWYKPNQLYPCLTFWRNGWYKMGFKD